MMINEIKTGISQALDTISDGEYEIMIEPTHQGLTEHTFYIDETNTIITRKACDRTDVDASMDILFYLAPDDTQAFTDSIEEKLYDVLELIEVDGKKVRGHNISVKTVDSVMHFSVTYDLSLLLKPEGIEKMEEITERIGNNGD